MPGTKFVDNRRGSPLPALRAVRKTASRAAQMASGHNTSERRGARRSLSSAYTTPAANNIMLHSASTSPTLRSGSDNSQVNVAAMTSSGNAENHRPGSNAALTGRPGCGTRAWPAPARAGAGSCHPENCGGGIRAKMSKRSAVPPMTSLMSFPAMPDMTMPCPDRPCMKYAFGPSRPKCGRAIQGDVEKAAPGVLDPRVGELRKHPGYARA